MSPIVTLLERLSRLRPEGTVRFRAAAGRRSREELIAEVATNLAGSEIRELDREDAIVWLGLLAAHSLCHGSGRDEAVALAAEIETDFAHLDGDTRFFSVGVWQVSRRGRHWEPVRAGGPWLKKNHAIHFSGPHVGNDGVLGAVMGLSETSTFLFAVTEDD